MPAPLLGPNSVNPHGQPEVQSYLNADTTNITAGLPVVYNATGVGASVVNGATTPAGIFAGIATKTVTKGGYVPVAISGPVQAKTSATPAAGAKLQIAATGDSLTTWAAGAIVGYALTASVNNIATVIIRLS